MNPQPIDSQAVKLLSQLIGQDLTVRDVTPQVLFMADLIALLKGVMHADATVSQDEVAQFKTTLVKLNLTSKQTAQVTKLLWSGIQKYQLHAKIDKFLILLNPLAKAERLLLLGLGYKMAMADSSLDDSESKYLRELGKRLGIELRYLDVLEFSFAGQTYNIQDFQELCNLVDPAHFHDLGSIFMNAADDLLTTLNTLTKIEVLESQILLDSVITTSEQYQKLQDFQIQKQSLLKRIKDISQRIDAGIKDSLFPITFRDEIQVLKDRLESQRFRVAVIGDFSQGKSTLLNALLGEEIQPVRAIPCSGTLSVLKYGDRKRVICRYRDGNEEEIAVEEYQKKAAMPKEAALNNRSEELLNSNIIEIIFEHPNLLLCRNGVEIVDSPGLNEHPERTRITEELLKETDAILFMTNANKLLAQGERETISRIKKRNGDRPLENFFLVVNFMDHVDSDEDREDVQMLANTIIKDNFITGNDRIHFISAKSALKASLNNISNEYLISFQNFIHKLESFLTGERGSVILQSVNHDLNELIQNCISELNNAIESLDIDLNTSYQEEILERIGEASGRFISIRKAADSLRQQTTDLALTSWQQHSSRFQESIEAKSKEWKTEHGLFLNRNLLIQDYVDQFNVALQEELNTWVNFSLNKTIISPQLNLLENVIKDELKELQSGFYSLDQEVGTKFSDSFRPVFEDFDVSYVAAWAAGGIIGGGAGAAAAFFMIPALAFAPAVIMGVAAAVILGGGGLLGAAEHAKEQIAKQVCKSGFEEFNKSEHSIKEKGGEFISNLFDARLQSVKILIEQIISECENRLELEMKKQKDLEKLRSIVSSKKQEFEKSLPV